jgi:hypothetical protein
MAENNNNIYDPNYLNSLEAGSENVTTESAEYTSAIEKTKASIEQAKATQEFISALQSKAGGEWPQNTSSSGSGQSGVGAGQKGFLPPILLSPSLERTVPGQAAVSSNGNYTYKDWRGQELSLPTNVINTEDRFKLSLELPKQPSKLKESPYSQRDIPLIFGDSRYDYFRNGLQTLDNLNPIENPINGNSTARLSNFTSTPFENNDPVMFGFEIIIDAVNSPLLNGSVIDFINNYSGINEVAARRQVYEDFKQQFIKFFRTSGTVRISDLQIPTLSKMGVNAANQDGQINIFWPGKKAYLGYYIKKVTGLAALVETNKGDGTIKYFADYKKDFITLDFLEDVSLSVGTLAHLYKLLYWSKPNGKGVIPENLLRFNCEIIISECRNFQRTRKAAQGGNLEIVKDNLSRYIYSLRECQFYFDKMTHEDVVDLGDQGPKTTDNYQVSFDYKYSTHKFERFVPSGNFGQYVGYNAGAIWKIGNPGERENRGLTAGGLPTDSSIPKFFTVGTNQFNENGVASAIITKIEGDSPINNENFNSGEDANQSESLDDTKKASEKNAKQASEEKKVEETIEAQGSQKGSTLDIGKSSAEESVKKEKNKAKASVSNEKNKKLNAAIDKFKSQAKTGGQNVLKNLEQRAENQALNVRNQFLSKAKQEKDKMVNTALNEARNVIQTSLSDMKNNMTNKSVNTAKNASSTPNNKSGEQREKLLNQSLEKIRNQGLQSLGELNPQPPNSTQFFDTKGQLLNFAGPSLGGSLGGL